MPAGAVASTAPRADLAWTDADGTVAILDASGTTTHLGTPGSVMSWPSWSPDGSLLAWEESDADGTRFVIADRAGNVAHTFPTAFAWDGPRWSPDGSRLAFRATTEIAVVSADGSNLTKVADLGGLPGYWEPRELAWSPDGSRLAWSYFDLVGGGVFVGRADGSGAAAVGPTDNARGATWSADGRLLWADGNQLFIGTVDPMTATTVPTPGYVHPTQPAWSPDGTRLAFVATNATTNLPAVVSLTPAGTDLVDLTPPLPTPPPPPPDEPVWVDTFSFGWPAWSPDGSRVAFSVIDTVNPFSFFHTVWLGWANADGTNAHTLDSTFGLSRPVWSPDGNWLAADGQRDECFIGTICAMVPAATVGLINADGTAGGIISGGGTFNAWGATWRPPWPPITTTTSTTTTLATSTTSSTTTPSAPSTTASTVTTPSSATTTVTTPSTQTIPDRVAGAALIGVSPSTTGPVLGGRTTMATTLPATGTSAASTLAVAAALAAAGAGLLGLRRHIDHRGSIRPHASVLDRSRHTDIRAPVGDADVSARRR